MRIILFTPTGLGRTIEAESMEDFRKQLSQVAEEIRSALDY
jgi:hypothetical protein